MNYGFFPRATDADREGGWDIDTPLLKKGDYPLLNLSAKARHSVNRQAGIARLEFLIPIFAFAFFTWAVIVVIGVPCKNEVIWHQSGNVITRILISSESSEIESRVVQKFCEGSYCNSGKPNNSTFIVIKKFADLDDEEKSNAISGALFISSICALFAYFYIKRK